MGELPSPEVFKSEVWPGLREVPVRHLVEATGLGRPYCAKIRRGEAVPHPRHWEALRSLAVGPDRASAPSL